MFIFRQRAASIRGFVSSFVRVFGLENFYVGIRLLSQPFHVGFKLDIFTSNARAWLSNATLRLFTLAEQCHTHEILI